MKNIYTKPENKWLVRRKRKLNGFEAGFCGGLMIIVGVGAVGGIKSITNEVIKAEDKQIKKELSQFMDILDTNKNGYLDEEETQRFYDEMQLSPQATPFSQLTRYQWNSYISMYKGRK